MSLWTSGIMNIYKSMFFVATTSLYSVAGVHSCSLLLFFCLVYCNGMYMGEGVELVNVGSQQCVKCAALWKLRGAISPPTFFGPAICGDSFPQNVGPHFAEICP